jgi:hypothetical protein
MLKTALRVIVLGYIVRGPVGGLCWHHLHYVAGLAALGHDVYFVEDSGDSPWCCYDPSRHVTDANPTYGLEFARRAFDGVGLAARWAYYDAHTRRWLGPCADRIVHLCASADLLLNVSGVNPLRSWLLRIPVRAFIDTDPVFTQISHLTDPATRALALDHTAFFSFGANIGQDQCSVPDDGFAWQPTRQPCFLDAWPVAPSRARGRFTTVMQWDSYPAREFNGSRYGMKSDSFGPYLDLPGRAGPVFELAVGGPSPPKDLLREKGWALSDPLEVARDPWAYQRYIQQSKGEFSVAKHGYVVTRSGWFSERSVAYLASGRPVLVQETGFSDWLPTGSGVVPFASVDEAAQRVEVIDREYERHCQAARRIAEECFDSGVVLPRLIEDAMSASESAVRDVTGGGDRDAPAAG